MIKRLFIGLLIFNSFYLMTGCSGCSKSGIRDKQKKRDYSSTTSNKSNVSTKAKSDDKIPPNRNDSPQKKAIPLNVLFEKYKTSVFEITTSDGLVGYLGTGFFISKSGIAVSNYHVFKGTSKGLEVIETYDGHRMNVEKVLSISDENDYIIFKVRLSGYKISNPISIAKLEPQVGEDVFAIGNPRGLSSTLSKGIVSGFREHRRHIQMTTEITHGSSGGPLFNMQGEVIGITTMGYGEANLNFAVNINNLPLHKYNLGN